MKKVIIKLSQYFLSDKIYLKLTFRYLMKEKLSITNPVSFNQKIQWLKLYDRKDKYTELADKYLVKEWISKEIGDEYNIPTLGIWNSFDEINFDKLPNEFVLKCTHDSGSVLIVKDKSKINKQDAKLFFDSAMKKNYFYVGREWAYKNVVPRIIGEKYIEDSNNELVDYKFNCFNGDVDSVMVCLDRKSGNPKFLFFDQNWKLKKYNESSLGLSDDFIIPKPKNIDKMFCIAQKLSQEIPFVRVDLYNVDGEIYFGEMTFYPHGGYDKNLLDSTEAEWGNKIKIKGELS
ncbi:ATP-grasp fold amidoligase family protein [Vagococcus fluvialis]|uniref:ATP-grasp fold amidoligase family protein n=1 Tax=Vagococcus fluvialis TaxID=2738 RepID=UPI003D09C1C1